MKTIARKAIIVSFIFIINACATYAPQYKNENKEVVIPQEKEIEHTFYLIGDAGNSPIGLKSETIQLLETHINKAKRNSTLLFLGDNIYPNGFVDKTSEKRLFAEHQLKVQTNLAKKFKGETVFIPGNHDWYSGLKGLKRQEKYIENALGKNTFLPENGCPLKKVNISDNVVMIVVDSHWYITNWNKHPNINDNCEIKTRTKFFDELEGLIKKARGKTTIIAIHHPIYTNGPHGGQFSLAQQLKPLPILGTIKNVLRKTSGITNTDQSNKYYNELKKRIITLSQENEKVIFVSGHEHSLQYIVEDNLPQIVSGSGSKTTATRNINGGLFSYGKQGFAKLDVYKNGSSYVQFYSIDNKKPVYQTKVLNEDKKEAIATYNSNFYKTKVASIYSKAEVSKGNLYEAIWGKRYREDFGTKIKAPTVNLDTLFGGLKPIRKGGGHQSKSLRLEDKQGREYVMRALRKNALQYLQAVAFKDQYIEGQFNNTYTQDLLLDVFTGSHPYAPFVIGELSDAIGVFHTNPTLYYVPKQKALSHFNNTFGDELYMIEERAASGHDNLASFGFSNTVISTDDLLNKLNKDEDFKVDEASYIRARLFDMLIGDWDRHEDQWRWAEFKEKGKTVYKPIPRDRDQAFSIMGDGALLKIATSIVPALRLMKTYDQELKSPKWFNLEPYPLDMALINRANKEVWNAQVQHITNNLTDEIINKAFSNFPPEVNQNTIQEIKQKLIGRRANLQKIANQYYTHINKFGVIKGTNKDDWFDVERLKNGNTKVTAYRIIKGKKEKIFHERIYAYKETKELWIYGLGDDDVFNVFGAKKAPIKIRLIGGQNKDKYTILNKKRVKIYDYKSEKNTFTTNKVNKTLTNNYKTNVYNYKKLKHNANQLIPSIGANPDDGFKIGLVNTFSTYGFERNPFTQQHKFSAMYFFATNGYDINYNGEFANVIGFWNLGIHARFSSPNYAINFFGYGNETPNFEVNSSTINLDYNRVKLQTLKFAPSLIWKGQLGANFMIGLSYENIEVERTTNRFINTFYVANNEEVENEFAGIKAHYSYENKDNKAFPTIGMQTALQLGYTTNLQSSKGYMYLKPELAFDYKLIPNGQLVLATKAAAHLNFGNNFEFYQAATLGANNGLRGYRNQRFTGKRAFVQSTDLRFNLRKIKTGLLPLNIGFYAGADYGRVWLKNDNSKKFNNSFGGGLFFNGANLLVGNLSLFNSNDGLRLGFKLGFGF